jgi:hypothetical protein
LSIELKVRGWMRIPQNDRFIICDEEIITFFLECASGKTFGLYN